MVIYASWNSIKETLDYDFNTEKQFSYESLSLAASVKHLAKFASDIWQIHPFCEGNTRATAVFMIKYLKTFGFEVNNDTFEKHSWYFRNALVRANYNDLKNRHMHVDYVEELAVLKIITKEPDVKQKDLVIRIGKSLSTIKRLMESLQQKNYIRRTNGKRYGTWEVLVDVNEE